MKKVYIITTAFFDLTGEDLVLGGNERYLHDFLNIYQKLGFKCIVFQPSKVSFEKNFSENVIVKGIPYKNININSYMNLSKRFYEWAKEADIVHYQSFTLGYPRAHSNSIAICHGVSWDKPISENWGVDYTIKDYFLYLIKKKIMLFRYKKAVKNYRTLICNDTNFINWMRVEWPQYAHKAFYIPNYVDLSLFTNNDNERIKHTDQINILFPRRLSKERGYHLALRAAEIVMSTYPNVLFTFTGIPDEFGMILKQKFKDRLIFKSVHFDEMSTLYSLADIVIIPTIHSEGTSLSCLEAMAMGVPVISTNVGGLTNLIIDGYNGLLINPTLDDLVKQISLLITDSQKRKYLGENGKKVAKAFSKDIWEEKMIKRIEELITNDSRDK